MSEQQGNQPVQSKLPATRARWCAVVLSLACLVLTGCADGNAPTGPDIDSSHQFTIAGFKAGYISQMRADGIAEACRREHPEWEVTSIAAGGESRIIEKRISGELDFFFTNGVRQLELLVQEPLHPDIDFETASDYRLVLPLYYMYVHIPARKDTGLTEPSDIVEQRYPFRLGSGGGVARLLFEMVLEHHGASLDDAVGWGASIETIVPSSQAGVEALRSGRIDLGFTYGGIPSSNFAAYTGDLVLLPVEEPGLMDMFAEWGFVPGAIPADTYPFLSSDVQTMASPKSLSTRPDTPDEVVYGLLEAMFAHPDISLLTQGESPEVVTPESIRDAVALAERNSESYHPAALQFFRDQEWMD